MSGYKTWSSGEILTAANVQDYLQDQSVMVFGGTAARATAIASPTEGMVSYLSDSNILEVFYDSSWHSVGKSRINSITASYTAVSGDANDTIYVSGTAAVTITIPDVFDVGDRIDIWRNAGGTVTIAAGNSVTSWAGAGTAGTAVQFKIDQTYNAATVQKVAANTYRVVGRITV